MSTKYAVLGMVLSAAGSMVLTAFYYRNLSMLGHKAMLFEQYLEAKFNESLTNVSKAVHQAYKDTKQAGQGLSQAGQDLKKGL